jgi:hypothetical protein
MIDLGADCREDLCRCGTLRNQGCDPPERCLLVGDPCERFACLRVHNRRREQIRELGEAGSGALGEALGVCSDDRPPDVPGNHDRDATLERRPLRRAASAISPSSPA